MEQAWIQHLVITGAYMLILALRNAKSLDVTLMVGSRKVAGELLPFECCLTARAISCTQPPS